MSEYVSHVPSFLPIEDHPFGRYLTAEEEERAIAVTEATRAAVAAYIDAHPATSSDERRYLERYVEYYEQDWFGVDAPKTVDEVVESFFH